MTAIKICGITRLEDAEAAVALGATALGFVLWPRSPRHAPLETVKRIVAALPPFVIKVGVFVDPTADEVIRGAASGGINVAQIHGEVPAWAGGRAPVPVLRAVHLGSGGPDSIEPQIPDRTILLDAHDPEHHGGTGQTVDWDRARAVARSRRVVLAGGLTPANVAEAIRTVRPYGVDVASGVEASPGVKDHELLRRFIDVAKERV
jgi:phosphoribosylanthranilate isomerase